MEVFASIPRMSDPVGNGGICSNGTFPLLKVLFAQTAVYPQMTLFTHIVPKAERVGYAPMVALEQDRCQPRSNRRNNRLVRRLQTSPQPDRHPHNQGSGPEVHPTRASTDTGHLPACLSSVLRSPLRRFPVVPAQLAQMEAYAPEDWFHLRYGLP